MMRIKKVFVVITATAALLSTLISPMASAISGWDAGRIIDDGIFTNKSSMSPGQIQTFLNSKVPECDSDGSEPSEYGGGTRAQWANAKYGQTSFTCLKDYREHGNSAAQMIYNVAQEFSINPQVLIVLLQKEQGLVTDEWPLNVQYRSATGYGCPDTAPCDSQYYGLANQLTWAGRMFRAILNNSPSWYTPYVLGNNFIRYSPDSSCGGSNVNIQNRSTQALYNYTPYQPNQAALNAGWGTASCGAYGNRNFYLYFTSWFGSTHDTFSNMAEPRWMQLRTAAYKKNTGNGENVDNLLAQGTQLYFPSKISTLGTTYLRTQHDTDNGLSKGVDLINIQEIPYEALSTPRWMKLESAIKKKVPRNGSSIDGTLQDGRHIFFTSKITVNGQMFLRTAQDTTEGNNKALPLSALGELSFDPLVEPRIMEVNKDTYKKNVTTGATTGSLIPKGSHIMFDTKVLINDVWYLRASTDTTSDNMVGIPLTDISNISYVKLAAPRSMKLAEPAKKVNPFTGQSVDPTWPQGRIIPFTTKIYVNGQWYLRSEVDTRNGIDLGIPLIYLSDL